jgi:hypothetical protein
MKVGQRDAAQATIVFREGCAKDAANAESLSCAVCHGMQQVFEFMKKQHARSFSPNELVTPAHGLFSQLSAAEPRRRDRSS